MPLVFLSYRRRDSQDITRRIHDELTKAYGEDTIFLDEKSIPKSEDIREYLRDVLSQCAVVLPVIASEWLNSILSAGPNSGSWLKPNDWVRLEIEEALKCVGVKIVPLLIDGVTMPRAECLPESIQDLAYRNGFLFSTKAFREDMPRLIRELDRLIDGTVLPLPQKPSMPSDDDFNRLNQYRHEVRYCLESNNGQFDSISDIYLEALRKHLRLTSTEAKSIKAAALLPYIRYKNAVRELVNFQNNGNRHSSQNHKGKQISLVPTLDRRAINHLRRLHYNTTLPRWKAIKIEHEILYEYRRARKGQHSGQF